ncbi:alpha/beta hydrolase [Elongatibacter sediminis]|uniref:Alpha/beta fold hydrolase n=1 Tax=Elongatibacter sediminis TaxID=3119006 RepID=A0AAW9REP7_9GAMM
MTEDDSAGLSRPGTAGLPALETVEVETGPDPVASIIWLHGLGADGHDFEPAVPHLAWRGAPPLRFVFPHSPERAVTVNAGMRMRAWYDIVSLGGAARDQDEAGIEASIGQVADLVVREGERGIPSERVIVAGFSQGGAIAIQLALRYPQRLAGLVALSTYLLQGDRLGARVHAANRDLPVFMGHGQADPVVPFAMGEQAAAALRSLGYAVEWRAYPIPHSVSADELAHVADWMRRRLDGDAAR